MRATFGAVLVVAVSLGSTLLAVAQSNEGSEIVGDAIPLSLTGRPGDPARGRAIVVARQRGLCLLCHTGPFPEERFQGTLGPDLSGVGTRLSEGQIRLRLVDARRFDPRTIMPPYGSTAGLTQVSAAWRGKPLLSVEEIEDVIAFLATLRDTPPK